MRPMCKNCSSVKDLQYIEVTDARTGHKYGVHLCPPCKEIWEDYAKLETLEPVDPEEEKARQRMVELQKAYAPRVRKVPFDGRRPRGFQDTACRIDVVQYMTTESSKTLAMKLNGYFHDREKK